MSDKDNLLFGVKPRYARKSLYRGSLTFIKEQLLRKTPTTLQEKKDYEKETHIPRKNW